MERDGYILRKRSAVLKLEHALSARFGDDLILVGYTLPMAETVMGGQGIRLLTGWQTARKLSEHYLLHLNLYDSQGHLWVQCPGTLRGDSPHRSMASRPDEL